MSAIIKTLKTTTNDVEQSVYPKTVLEAVVDTDTNQTLHVILDNIKSDTPNGSAYVDFNEQSGEVTGEVEAVTSAKLVSYSNTESGIEATNVQDAIDKIEEVLINGINVSNNDFNNLGNKAFIGYGSNMLNDPLSNTAATYIIQHIPVFNNMFTLQYAKAINWNSGELLYFRQKNSSDVWSEWTKTIVNCSGTQAIPGQLIVQGGTRIADFGFHNWGTVGYTVIAKIETAQSFLSNGKLEFDITTLGASGKVRLQFTNTGTPQDTTIFNFNYYNTPNMYYVLTKGSAGITVEIIAQKSAYQSITISNVIMSKHVRDRLVISYPDTFETTLRDGAIAATEYNPWSRSSYVIEKTVTLTLKKYSAYIINLYSKSDTQSYTVLVNPNSNGTFHLTELFTAGSWDSSLSGTTLTITNPSITSGIYYKYIEIIQN